MTKLLIGLASACVYAALHTPVSAQAPTPITNGEVLGNWLLTITPVAREDLNITFESRSGGQRLEFPLTVTARPNGRLSCISEGEPIDCRIRNGDLVVSFGGGGVRMLFNLTERARTGFAGIASMRVRLLPIGGQIGTVAMTRR